MEVGEPPRQRDEPRVISLRTRSRSLTGVRSSAVEQAEGAAAAAAAAVSGEMPSSRRIVHLEISPKTSTSRLVPSPLQQSRSLNYVRVLLHKGEMQHVRATEEAEASESSV